MRKIPEEIKTLEDLQEAYATSARKAAQMETPDKTALKLLKHLTRLATVHYKAYEDVKHELFRTMTFIADSYGVIVTDAQKEEFLKTYDFFEDFGDAFEMHLRKAPGAKFNPDVV